MKRLFLTSATVLLAANPALSQDMFLDDATVIDANGVISTTDIQLSGGIITAIGADLTATDGSETMTSMWVSPGLISSYSTLGIVDIGGERSTNDTQSATDLASISIQAADSFNPREVHIANARRRGVMYAAVTSQPTGNMIFGGTGLIASLNGSDSSVIDDTAFIHLALGEAGSLRAGNTRGAAIAQLEGALDDTRRDYFTQDEGDVLRRRDAQALRTAVAGRVPLLIAASRASDLHRIIALTEEFPSLDVIVVGAEEAHLLAEDIAEAGLRLIVDPLENLPDTFDTLNASLDNVRILDAAGVDYAIAGLSSFRVVKAGGLAQHAGNAVAQGLSREAAFRSITGTPARWFGIDLGEIREGIPTSLIIWDGDPMEVTSAPIVMYDKGEALSLESRMTALRDRYNPTSDDERPYKYR